MDLGAAKIGWGLISRSVNDLGAAFECYPFDFGWQTYHPLFLFYLLDRNGSKLYPSKKTSTRVVEHPLYV